MGLAPAHIGDVVSDDKHICEHGSMNRLRETRCGSVSHVKTLPGNPYDGHTLESVIPEIEALTGNTLKRVLAAAGYNSRLLLRWLAILLRRFLRQHPNRHQPDLGSVPRHTSRLAAFFTGD